MDNRAELIGALSDAFKGDKSLQIREENYISNTGSLDCTAFGIPTDSLEKTKRVIEQHEKKYRINKDNDPNAGQYLIHLGIARKCVEEIIAEKKKAMHK